MFINIIYYYPFWWACYTILAEEHLYSGIPEWAPEYRKEEAKKMWMYEKAEDFVLGLTIGMIYADFESFF